MELIPWRNKSGSRTGRPPAERPLVRFRDEIENVFDRLWRDPWSAGLSGLTAPGTGGFPQLDLAESDDDVTVRAELPGMRPEDVRIELTGNVLKLSGEKSEQKEERERGYHYRERQFGSFSRMVQLPASVDPDKVDARYRDGVLTITLAKHAAAKPKRITVRNA